ncbi:hypothetical protein SDJN02_12347, partial [Cucurbita argyrosperma subsp. argyrosperma]
MYIIGVEYEIKQANPLQINDRKQAVTLIGSTFYGRNIQQGVYKMDSPAIAQESPKGDAMSIAIHIT